MHGLQLRYPFCFVCRVPLLSGGLGSDLSYRVAFLGGVVSGAGFYSLGGSPVWCWVVSLSCHFGGGLVFYFSSGWRGLGWVVLAGCRSVCVKGASGLAGGVVPPLVG